MQNLKIENGVAIPGNFLPNCLLYKNTSFELIPEIVVLHLEQTIAIVQINVIDSCNEHELVGIDVVLHSHYPFGLAYLVDWLHQLSILESHKLHERGVLDENKCTVPLD